MRLVCPYCGSDEQLYSVEMAALMYPVRARGEDGEIYHIGEEYIVADDTTFEGRIYCRGDDEDLRVAELLIAAGCVDCGETVFRAQDTARPRLGEVRHWWRDARGVPTCAGSGTPHQVGA